MTKEEHVEKLVNLFKEGTDIYGRVNNSDEIVAAFMEIPLELRGEVIEAVENSIKQEEE